MFDLWQMSSSIIIVIVTLVLTTPVNALPVFSENTYVQSANKPLLQKNRSTEAHYPSEEIMRDILGDENGTLVTIRQ